MCKCMGFLRVSYGTIYKEDEWMSLYGDERLVYLWRTSLGKDASCVTLGKRDFKYLRWDGDGMRMWFADGKQGNVNFTLDIIIPQI